MTDTQIAVLSPEDIANTYTVIVDREDDADRCARGLYQRDLLAGDQAWSGSTLTGTARRYAVKYARSRRALLDRLTEAGIPWCEVTGAHGRRVVVVGAARARVEAGGAR